MIVVVIITARATYIRLVQSAEMMLRNLRVAGFAHIHALSIADHNESRRGELTARVTSDVETIAQFAQWGGIAWVVNSVIIVGTLAVMAVYSWQLTLVTIVVMGPLLPLMRALQRRQLQAYDVVRMRVGQTLSVVSETVMGAAVVRAYGIAERVREPAERGDRPPVPRRAAHGQVLRVHVPAGRRVRRAGPRRGHRHRGVVGTRAGACSRAR